MLLWLPPAAHAGSITTSQIVARTSDAALACMRWMPVGTCFWLRCSLSGCRVKTSLKVGHYLPDAVISSYNELGGNPWVEIRTALGLVQRNAVDGLLTRLLNVAARQCRQPHRGWAGEPGSPQPGVPGGGRCWPSPAVPVRSCRHRRLPVPCPDPVPLSLFPVGARCALAWRTGAVEMLYPASLAPGLRELGSWPAQSWGSVYPRTGWVIQAEEPKAAAVAAQRAADIVTRTRQPHVYVPMTGRSRSGQKVWRPGPLLEDDPDTGEWQMLHPKPESSCGLFGSSDLASRTGWGGGRVDAGGDYAWSLWRPYSCCRDRGSFLFEISWTSYPP